jgi:hypothetical protein
MPAIEWESPHERRFIHIALACPVIAAIQHQPFKVRYPWHDGKEHTYTPDFQVTTHSGLRFVVEIKTERFVKENTPLFDCCAPILEKAGARFYVLTEASVAKERANRATLWKRYARVPADQDQIEVAVSALRAADDFGRPLQDLMNAGVAIETLYHLLGRRIFSVGPSLETLPTAVVTFNEQGSDDERLQFENWFGCSAWRTHVSIGERA